MSPGQARAQPRVLLVDDEDDVRNSYAKALRALGFTVETAVDGQGAVEALHTTAYDLIVSDLSMPRMTGLEFLRAVRQHDLDVPVVLMTGRPDLASAVESIEYGAFRYLMKPVDIDELARVVRRAATIHEMAKLRRRALEWAGSDTSKLGDRASLDACFTRALEQVWMAYQPIVRWRQRREEAFEALVRSTESTLMSPYALVDAAERLGRLHELGRTIRETVARSASAAPADAMLFVNLHAADLNDPQLYRPDAPLSEIATRVVLEITERASLHEVTGLAHKAAELRGLGFRIAIDDLGSGYAGLTSFSQLDPEFAKLDMSLVRGIDASPRKRSIVRAMVALCTDELGIQVVCEGIETAEERDVLASEGCELLQGYLFAMPDRGFPKARW